MAIREAPELRPQPARRRRRWPIYIVVLLVLLVVLWLGYWFAATRVAEAAISRVTSGPVAGFTVGCSDRSVAGFPLRVDVSCQRPTVSSTVQALAASVGGIFASAPLYRPGYVEATLEGPLQVDMPSRGLALTASWSAASATASAWLTGLTGGTAHFDGLSLDNGGRPDALPVTKVATTTADAGLAPLGGGNYHVTAGATGLNVTMSNGSPFPALDISAALTANGVGALGTDPATAFAAWLRNGGTVKIDNLRIAAVGAVLLVNGDLTLSKTGLLNGSLLVAYNDLNALGKFIDTLKPGTSQKDATQLQLMNGFTKTLTTPEGTFHQTGVVVADGQILFLGVVPLGDPIPAVHL